MLRAHQLGNTIGAMMEAIPEANYFLFFNKMGKKKHKK
jgi:hypothetical protein